MLDGLLNIILPKKKAPNGGVSNTPTFQPDQKDQVLTVPQYRDHLTDLFTSRQANNSQDLLKALFRQDPDVSATVNGYLTLANTEMVMWATDAQGAVDRDASNALATLVTRLTRQVDYTLGFQLKQSIYQLNADLRYMLLLRGGIGAELVFDKAQLPDSIRQVDLASIRWYEKASGVYKPGQSVQGRGDPVMLDTPAFFVSFYRRDPTTIYTDSTFIAAINTIAARQQVINDLYRIMQITGFPRMDIKVLEEVIINRAPANIKADPTKLREFVNNQVAAIQSTFQSLRADQSVVHTDSVEFDILNGSSAAVALDVTNVVETLNAQNQAALKTMATVLGRGSAGVNTGSVEARLAAMYADELNEPLAEMYEKMFSFCLHQQGFQGFANVKFRQAELRPDLELETMRQIKTARMRQDLSDGIITDIEYALEMYGRLPNPTAPELSGTGFMTPTPTAAPNAADISPNTDPLGRSLTPGKTGATKTNLPKRKS
ncbi:MULTISPECIES: hypothetical protein [unclassified Beijerinckia]|uniref:hypothetical protein n=1 Tax=unclassified Beijerinckia TaxID=2638183 RepID=UPI00089A220D|nr:MULTISPECIES: hypothetical protein [unclassified Beijerinckia]MDH7796419.1 hypothetical protein [Beijerinckia sp. GAS462]SEC44288.1 hypothetical protein SAMN05443249_2701 [Beijerinckia sp. 28-YEA-48]